MTEFAYIHVPFCVKKCNYCAFVSFNKIQRKKEYLQALKNEIKSRYKGELLSTIYFGGGTPSLLSCVEVFEILSAFNRDETTEVTIEVNPNRLNLEYLKELRAIGVNRLSIGAQVFDDDILRGIGRVHTSADIFSTVSNARKAGFENISLDLIYGLPNQSLEKFKYSLEKNLELDVEHVSLYGLKIEEGTAFYTNLPENLPDDDLQADMYLLACDFLRENGFEKYEISNFARDKNYSKHNLNYWNANTYYGFGCGAHGYENGVRYENQSDLSCYILNPLKKVSESKLSIQEMLEESIFLGFRRASGIDTNMLKEKYGYDFDKQHARKLSEYIASGHVIKTSQGYAFSDNGFLLSNIILSEFI